MHIHVIISNSVEFLAGSVSIFRLLLAMFDMSGVTGVDESLSQSSDEEDDDLLL